MHPRSNELSTPLITLKNLIDAGTSALDRGEHLRPIPALPLGIPKVAFLCFSSGTSELRTNIRTRLSDLKLRVNLSPYLRPLNSWITKGGCHPSQIGYREHHSSRPLWMSSPSIH